VKVFALAAGVLALATAAPAAESYKVDKNHSEVSFQVKHLISQVRGRFTDFEGTFELDAADPGKSTVDFKIKTASIDTANPSRDTHLKSADFFDAEKMPEITFKSTSIKKTGENTYDVTGPFTLHGVTRTLTLPVTYTGAMKDARGNDRAGFELLTTLNRKDYGMVWNTALDAGGFVLGDEVKVSINLSLVKPKPEAAAPAAK
jgi:polyisoprenoid-binding protein YceI